MQTFSTQDPRHIAVVLLSVLQLATVYSVAILTEKELFWWLAVPAGVEIAIVALPVYVLPRLLRWRNIQAIGVFLQMIRDPIEQVAPDDDVRCSIFKPSLRRKRLIEVAICTKAGLATRKNKYMSIYQGVAGRAFREKSMSYVPIQAGNWRTHLMRDLGFTEQELTARKFRSDRQSYLGIPILKRGADQEVEVLAVVCLDSKNVATFTEQMIAEIEKVTPYIADILT
jgi:hypothetical protein